MKKYTFPYIALALGLILLLIIVKGSETASEGTTIVPLLTLLVVNEFAFFATAIGVYLGIIHMKAIGIKYGYLAVTLLCGVLSITFLVIGFKLWPL
ncbi:hypothetical protein [Kaarinaea lacus]